MAWIYTVAFVAKGPPRDGSNPGSQTRLQDAIRLLLCEFAGLAEVVEDEPVASSGKLNFA